MYRLKNIKQNILIVSFATLLVGCGGGETSTSTTSTDSTTSTTAILKVVTVQTNEPITSETSATINWIPNEYITKLVEYGTSRKYGSEVLVQEEGTITLDNLQPNTLYHYRIVAEDTNGKKVVSRDKTFTTLEQNTEPVITEPIVTEPAPTEPIATEPAPIEPIVTEPAPTEPIVTEPAPTEPIVTESAPTEPIVTEPTPTPVDPSATAKLLYDDMYLDHEGYPHGVPSYYEWAQGPIIRDTAETLGDFQATAGWGAVFEEINGNPSVNTRVELKNYKVYYLSKSDNKWHELANIENITDGSGYVEDFSDDTGYGAPADIKRFEPNGHVSAKPGSGYNYHFYTSRKPIDPNDIAQIAASCEAKLILEDANGVDDRHLAKFVLNIGMDAWRTMDAVWNPEYTANHDMGLGRFKYVTNEWRKFTFMTNMPLVELQENPPPL